MEIQFYVERGAWCNSWRSFCEGYSKKKEILHYIEVACIFNRIYFKKLQIIYYNFTYVKFQRWPAPDEMCYECQEDGVCLFLCVVREKDRPKIVHTLSTECRRNKYTKLENEYYGPKQWK
jgi:hypothetical protein